MKEREQGRARDRDTERGREREDMGRGHGKEIAAETQAEDQDVRCGNSRRSWRLLPLEDMSVKTQMCSTLWSH